MKKTMNNNGWRHGFCSQHYHLQRAQTTSGDWLDFRKVDAQFFPMDRESALVFVTRHEQILKGIVSLKETTGSRVRLIKEIEYCISACDGRRVVTQDFHHPFKRPVELRQVGFLPWRMVPFAGGNLFTLRPLNDILQVNSFRKVNGAQFCC
jgi:hypothetical protein